MQKPASETIEIPHPYRVVFTSEMIFSTRGLFDLYCYDLRPDAAKPLVAVHNGRGSLLFYFYWKEIGEYWQFSFPEETEIEFREAVKDRQIEALPWWPVDDLVFHAKRSAVARVPRLIAEHPELKNLYAKVSP